MLLGTRGPKLAFINGERKTDTSFGGVRSKGSINGGRGRSTTKLLSNSLMLPFARSALGASTRYMETARDIFLITGIDRTRSRSHWNGILSLLALTFALFPFIILMSIGKGLKLLIKLRNILMIMSASQMLTNAICQVLVCAINVSFRHSFKTGDVKSQRR